jgi:hypothetical protein
MAVHKPVLIALLNIIISISCYCGRILGGYVAYD